MKPHRGRVLDEVVETPEFWGKGIGLLVVALFAHPRLPISSTILFLSALLLSMNWAMSFLVAMAPLLARRGM